MTSVDGDATGTISVATSAKPYPVRIVQVGGDSPGTVDFSDYDKPLTVQAPPADQVIDVSQFQQELQSV